MKTFKSLVQIRLYLAGEDVSELTKNAISTEESIETWITPEEG